MDSPSGPAPGSPAPPSQTSEPVDVAPTPQSLHCAVYTRRADYTRPHQIRVKIGTWNVAACPGTDQDLASWFVSGKGIDRRLMSVATTTNGAIERETSSDTLTEDASEDIRLIGGDKIGLYVLGLQEVVDLNAATQYMSRASAVPVLEKWKAAVGDALPAGYKLVVSEQMAGLLLLVYASPEVIPMLSHTSTSTVGTGLLGMLGNKGAVSAKVVLGEATSMVFVNSHLSSGNDPSHLDRRCWDVSQIENRIQFSPYNHPGVVETSEPEKLGDEDFAFWFGDLNFRLDGLPGDDIRRILTLHARGEYGLSHLPESGNSSNQPFDGEDVVVLKDRDSDDMQSSRISSWAASPRSFVSVASEAGIGADNIGEVSLLPDPDDFVPDASEDPASLQATLDSLLPHDQLHKAMKGRRALHNGWREGRIAFLPSYKYDVGSVGLFDSSEKRRPPSWCDRILYRTDKDKESYEMRIKEEEEARKRDEEMKARGLDQAGDEDEVLFEYQADLDGDGDSRSSQANDPSSFDYDEYDEANDEEEAEPIAEQESGADGIRLDIYTSHQRITSSDHKPVVSVFTVDFDAVVPELKAKVHAEVAKEFDRAENEGRPGVTVIMDGRLSSTATTGQRPNDAVDFGPIEFLHCSTASLTIANTGRVPAEFSFVEKPTSDTLGGRTSVDGGLPYPWLTTSFVQQHGISAVGTDAVDLGKNVTLEPGETVNALLEVLVDDFVFARILNDSDGVLEDVLVLRVVDGRDHFIPVRGVWMPTSIGRSVEELIRVPDGGIRRFIASRLQGKSGKRSVASGSIPYDLDIHCSAPKELFRLTEQIENLTDRVIADEQMLEECRIPVDKPGWPFEKPSQTPDQRLVVAVINALDNDRPILDAFEPEITSLVRLEVVSYVLVLFLRGLTDGIITIPLWSRIDQAPLLSLGGVKNASPSGMDPTCEDDKTIILDILSAAPYHNISFVFLTTALSRVIGELAPISLSDMDILRAISRTTGGGFGAAIGGIGNFGRRSLSSFRRNSVASASAALLALERRKVRERRVAEVFGKIMCRAPVSTRERERRSLEDKQRAVVELFLRRCREELG
ncbi:phosphatase family protein [Grosmannia clavigera kw1407]|uniref:Phosphatase family protein n=1 Tax=Grosmannia clavigera (strain kw1407 / UAMH 11150) TaxID=655863 RepID=F0XP17_GROCL|nr:phosphatase family protein [Grosmannia clavigera kw1407]EFX00150.1 phosphatase family protein [Grosmannia clavigera kw1407]